MAEVKAVALQAVPLPDGRLLRPGRTATDVDVTHSEVRLHIDAGALLVLTDDNPDADATVDEVLEWVGDDPERATAALATERGRRTPRKTLVEPLEQLLADNTTQEDDQ